ncbi:MAG: hypothetical protein IH969_07650, partial [Candidatus Krumholzibacteriota bacterium]|nr:hypothetical protein [Candidatus Krumholzibacteriota bacterium]
MRELAPADAPQRLQGIGRGGAVTRHGTLDHVDLAGDAGGGDSGVGGADGSAGVVPVTPGARAVPAFSSSRSTALSNLSSSSSRRRSGLSGNLPSLSCRSSPRCDNGVKLFSRTPGDSSGVGDVRVCYTPPHVKPAAQEYAERFDSFCDRTLYARLDKEEREAIRALAIAHRFTFQEFRQMAQGSRDLAMWGEPGVAEWSRERSGERAVGKESKKELLRALDQRLDGLKRRPTSYSLATAKRPAVRERKPVVTRKTDKKIYGMCPV